MPFARSNRRSPTLWVACFALAAAACSSDSGEATSASATSATTSTSSGGGEGGASTTTGAGGDGGGTTSTGSGTGGEGGAGGAPNPQTGVPGTELVNAGAIMSSPGYRLQLTVGQSSPLQTKASSPGHSIRGGVLGTTN
jgi:hypothetical protein